MFPLARYTDIALLATGFWGEKTYGWHYDLMLVIMNLVTIVANGGRWILLS